MIDQIIAYVSVERFQIGVAVGLVVFIILFLLSKIGRKSFDKETFYNDVLSINKNIQNSQKENIKAQKKLSNLYEMFKGVEGNLK